MSEEHLNADAHGTDAHPEAVAHVLESVASTMREAPAGTRYDFTLEVEER